MTEDIWLPGRFTDLTDPDQLFRLTELLQEILNRLNLLDVGSVGVWQLQGAAAEQIINAQGVGAEPIWTDTPTVAGLTLSGLTASRLVVTDAAKALSTPAPSAAYTPSNVTVDRAFDCDTVAVPELADVVATMIADLQTKHILG